MAIPNVRAGVWRAIVTKINSSGIFVSVPRLTGLNPDGSAPAFGTPCLTLASANLPRALVVGDRVLVAFLEGNPHYPVVLGRIVNAQTKTQTGRARIA